MVDSSVTLTQASIRTERPSPYADSASSPRAKETQQDSAATSQVGPDVVTSISSAGLEAARTVSQSSQAADQSSTEDAVRQSERQQAPPPPPPPERASQGGGKPPRGVDLMA